MSSSIKFAAGFALALTLVAGCAKDKDESEAAAKNEGPRPSFFEESSETTTATVEAIDQATRQVTLKNSDGESVTLTAGPEVENLAQVRVGDRVEAEYYESIAVNVNAPGAASAEPAVDVRQAAARTAEPGEKPAGIAARHVTITATVERIDPAKQTVTLRGPAGNLRTVKVPDRKKLDALKVGDVAAITYTEALAVALKPAP
ncbi:MAG: hypothetical protein WBD40_24730 [Tepidisphaeraceae bacterium]